jgi:hypothetical protein
VNHSMTCRKRKNEVKTGAESLFRDKLGRNLFLAWRPPALRWREIVMRQLCGTWEPSASMLTERFKQKPCESLSRNAARRGGKACSSKEVPEKGIERRGLSYRGRLMGSTGNGRNR